MDPRPELTKSTSRPLPPEFEILYIYDVSDVTVPQWPSPRVEVAHAAPSQEGRSCKVRRDFFFGQAELKLDENVFYLSFSFISQAKYNQGNIQYSALT
jgi:hypothetical protein